MFFSKKSSPMIKEWGNLSTTWLGKENVPPLNEIGIFNLPSTFK